MQSVARDAEAFGCFGLVVGVTDVMPGLMLFRTDITYECHGLTPYWEM
jgi:hypothetical protein